MDEKKLFQRALNLSGLPWNFNSIDFDQAEGRIGFRTDFLSGSIFSAQNAPRKVLFMTP
jgi:hypothetical protein